MVSVVADCGGLLPCAVLDTSTLLIFCLVDLFNDVIQQSLPLISNENEQDLDSSVKILLMKLLVELLSGDNFDGVISLGQVLTAPRSIYLHYF